MTPSTANDAAEGEPRRRRIAFPMEIGRKGRTAWILAVLVLIFGASFVQGLTLHEPTTPIPSTALLEGKRPPPDALMQAPLELPDDELEEPAPSPKIAAAVVGPPDEVLTAAEVNLSVARLIGERRFADLHADSILQAYRMGWNFRQEFPGAEVDLPKLRRGGVGMTFLSICSPPAAIRAQIKTWEDYPMIRYFKRVMANHPELRHVLTATDARRAMTEGKVAVVLTLEGAGVIGADPGKLQMLYAGGIRSVGLIWNQTELLGDAARDVPRYHGLSEAGRKAVRELERLGIMVDVSHASEEAFWDIMEETTGPVFASHSNAFAVRDHARNLKDDQIRAIAARGGIIGIAFHRTFLKKGPGPATLGDVVAHIKHIASVGGVGCVAIGTDFGGGAILPAGMPDIGQLPSLVRALLKEGFSEYEVRQIMGGNAMRYFSSICP